MQLLKTDGFFTPFKYVARWTDSDLERDQEMGKDRE